MPADNVEVVRGVIDALNRGDVDGAMEAVSTDCEIDWSNSRGVLKGVYRGRDEAREVWKAFLEAWDSLRWGVREFIELDDDRVVIVSEFTSRGSGSGVEVTASGASLWTIRDGEVAAVKLFQSKAEALDAGASGSRAAKR
jgi:ketosteroid isomerase-like protein